MATQGQTRSASQKITELTTAEKELRKFWERSRRVIKRFMDEMDPAQIGVSNLMNVDKFNLFWANVGVLKASLYANPPKPMVRRAFDDYMDDAGRVAGIMMERLLTQGLEDLESDISVAFCHTVEDRLIPGLGQVWLRYEPTIETMEIQQAMTDSKGRVIQEAITTEEIVNEEVRVDYVYWEDFLWSPARTWQEVRWVARRVWMNKREFKRRFPDCDPNHVNWVKRTPDKYGDRVTPEARTEDKTEVFEIWNKETKTACWVSKSYEYYLDEQADPLEIDGFWPCPKPLLATHTTSSLTPKADYLMTQSQYRRLDNLSMRIGLLEDAIQASGMYDKANKELSQLLSGNMNKMIPVDNWGMFAERGGMKGVVDWFPIEQVVQALDKLREVKNEAKAELYELTGISDIMRGTTAPRETLGAQEMKAQYSSVRLQYLQNEVAYFIQCVLRIKAEIISKHFQPKTIIRNSLIELTPDGEIAVPAVQIIKDQWASSYRIQVFADTLAIPDYNAERSGRMEFIMAAGQFISQVTQLLQIQPAAGVYMLQILQWGIAAFRSAQSIEGVFDKAIVALTQQIQAPKPPPPPDPNMIKANAAMITAQAKAGESQAEQQAMFAKFQAEQQRENMKAQGDVQRDMMRTQSELIQDQKQTDNSVQALIAKTTASVQATRMKTAAQIEATRQRNNAQMAAARNKK